MNLAWAHCGFAQNQDSTHNNTLRPQKTRQVGSERKILKPRYHVFKKKFNVFEHI
jgi:hypothetical protein